jgi:hypothetical protein
MAKSVPDRRFRGKRHPRFSKAMIAILIVVGAIVSIVAFSMANRSSSSVHAQGKQKRYKATRPIAVDKQTGKPRMPTQEEVDQVVANLATLASRPENLPQTPGSNGGIVVDLEGGYGGVMLARPNGEGTWETKCVFTFAEGVEFLGLVEDNPTE